ncbi:MAG: transcriptional regulator [Flavobacteriia bacterium]|nr:transcriptional regulator [Flavobacteriia bacterium]
MKILGSEWGINRTMAQVHAILLISPQPLSTENIMDELSISRGNANMNIRDLINWNLVHKELIPGDRKEYFTAEKDIWEIARRIIRERKKREMEPVIRVINQLKHVEGDKNNKDINEFCSMMDQLDSFVGKMDKSVNLLLNENENKLFTILFKLMT